MRCRTAEQQIQSHLLDDSRAPDGHVHDHLSTCERCAHLYGAVQAFRGMAPPAISDARRNHIIDQALKAVEQPPVMRSGLRNRLRLMLMVPALAIAATIVVLWIRPQASPQWQVATEGLVLNAQQLQQGQEAPLEQVLDVPVAQEARIAAGDGIKVVAKRNSRFVLGAAKARKQVQFTLIKGKTLFSVDRNKVKAPLVVLTDEARVEVVGTKFSVDRGVTEQSTTCVAVTAGKVRFVARSSGRTREVSGGQTVCASQTGGIIAAGTGEQVALPPTENRTPPKPVVSDAGLVDASSKPIPTPTVEPSLDEPSKPRKPSTKDSRSALKEIRAHLRQGDATQARALIRQAEKQRFSATTRAELKMLTAEADLLEHKYQSAFAKYRTVWTKFGRTRQAEIALFAGIKLARKGRAGAGQLDKLIERYLERFPNGMFRSDVVRYRK